MPSKLQVYTELSKVVVTRLTGSYQEWTAFLCTAFLCPCPFILLCQLAPRPSHFPGFFVPIDFQIFMLPEKCLHLPGRPVGGILLLAVPPILLAGKIGGRIKLFPDMPKQALTCLLCNLTGS